MNRGEVWLINFDPSIGSEIQKERRGVIVSQDGYSPLPIRIVVPFTSWQEAFSERPWMVYLKPDESNGITKVVAADAFQVKCVSTDRLIKRMGVLSAKQMAEIAAAVSMIIGHE